MVSSFKPLFAIALLASLAGCASAAEPNDANRTDDETGVAALISKAPSTEIAVVAIAKVKPGTEAAFQRAAIELVRGTRKEPGNLSYVLTRSTDDPTEFVFEERWASAAASDAHMSGPVLAAFFAEVKDDFEPNYPVIKHLGEVRVK